MGPLIDADALRERLKLLAKYEDSFRRSVILGVVHTIKSQPTIDPIHYAGGCYCHECSRWDKDGKGIGYERVCKRWSEKGLIAHYTMPADWCKWGRRREDAE